MTVKICDDQTQTGEKNKRRRFLVWFCEKQTLRGQRDTEGVLGAVLAVHSVIVCVSVCMWSPDGLY